MTGKPRVPRNLMGSGMDALRFIRRAVPVLCLAPLAAGCETLHPGSPTADRDPTGVSRYEPDAPTPGSAFERMQDQWDPAYHEGVHEERQQAIKARGQAPDGPKAPDVLPPIKAPDLSPAAAPVSAASYTPARPTPIADPLRDAQIQIAAYIGTDAVITEDEVWQMVRQSPAMRQLGTLAGAERAAKEKEIYKDELKKLIDRELVIIELMTRLKKNKKDDLIRELSEHAEKSAAGRLREYRKLNKFATEEEFIQVLAAQGLTYKGIRRQLERDALSAIFLDQTLKEKAKFVTLTDLWDYYQANPKEFATADRAKWLDLFVALNRFPNAAEAKQYADTVWREAAAGADFVALVRKYGQGDSNLRDGEGIGQKRGEVQPPEMEQVIFGMDAGQVSPLLQTATGYHLVKVVEREKAGVKPFDQQVQTDIREKLTRQLQKTEYEKLMDDLWRRYRPKVVE
jgi:peptidyl-prolyl cis-trans isomerase SurA